MVKEVISSILQAELSAEEIVKTAQINARKMIDDANETAKTIKHEASVKMKDERKSELSKTANLAQAKYDSDIEKAKTDALSLKAGGEKKLKTAVEFIVRRVVS